MFSKSSKFLIPALILTIVGSAYYIYILYSSRNLGLELIAPDEVMIGAPFDLKVGFSNQSGSVLKNVVLTVNLPEGMVFAGSGENKLIENKEFGNLGEDSLISETYHLIVLKGENTSQEIKATVSYSQSSLSAQFEKSGDKVIFVRGAGVSVDLAAPEKVFSGEEFDLNVNYKNISGTDFKDLEFKIDFPPSFTFISSTLKPDKNNNIWIFGDLNKGSEGKFAIKGSLVGPEGSSFSFKSNLKTNINGQIYNLELKEASILISSSPLSLNISLNGKQEYVSQLGDELNYVLNYANNTDVALRDVAVRAQLIGELFEMSSLETNSMFRLSDNTLIWNSGNVSELNYVAPHTAGFVKFKILTKEEYPIRRFSDKNYVLKVSAEIESPTIPGNISASKTHSVAKMETKVAGNIEVGAAGYFRDADSGILNKGTIPLQVGQPTDFTIHWILKIYAADVSNIEIKAPLAEGVKFTGVAKSDIEPAPFYDEKTNQIVWMLNKLPANRGVVDQPVEGIFQIKITPSVAQAGKYANLMGETAYKATDNFTNAELSGFAAPIDTSLPDDATMGAKGGVVQP